MSSLKYFFLCLSIVFFSGCATIPPPARQPSVSFPGKFEQEHQQVIIVESIKDMRAKLTTWEYKHNAWYPVSGAIAATVGINGIAPKDEKREGDGRTPSGVFDLKLAFGYDPEADTKLTYRQATENDFWVDDPKSPQYNQWVTGTPQANSFEYLKRKDDLYKLGIVIEYNTQPIVPGNGSAIFMHIWKEEGAPTSGCVALSEMNIRKLLHWLDLSRKPVIIIVDPHTP